MTDKTNTVAVSCIGILLVFLAALIAIVVTGLVGGFLWNSLDFAPEVSYWDAIKSSALIFLVSSATRATGAIEVKK